MQIKGPQLVQQLKQGLHPVYLVFTDDPFLLGQALDSIRSKARENGFEERIRLTQDKDFDWGELHQAGQTMSLFTSQQIIELELPDAKPGRDGGSALAEYAANANNDQILLLFGPRLRKEQQNTKWFKALSNIGVSVALYPPDRSGMPDFIRQRASHHQVMLDEQAVQLLAQWYEGNLLALDQELAKLALLYPQQEINADLITQASEDQSRYDVFALRDALLQQRLDQYFHILERLAELGEEPVLIFWTLSRYQQTLDRLASHLNQPQELSKVFQQERIWQSQKQQWSGLARRWSPGLNNQSLQLLKRCEFAIKRDSGENVFVLFAHLGALYCQNNEAAIPEAFTEALPDDLIRL